MIKLNNNDVYFICVLAPKRTQDILRAFINFYFWSDLRVSGVREEKTKLIERQNKMTEMRKLKEDLRENLNTITKAIAQIKDAKSQVLFVIRFVVVVIIVTF